MKTVLLVCTANICRSPMAAALLRQRLEEAGLAEQVVVRSAGTWAREGLPASDYAIATLADQGIALGEHRSQLLTTALLDEADIVLVMEEVHRRSIFYLAPQSLAKVFLFSELVGGHENIADPYGGTMEDYARTVRVLEALIKTGWPRLLEGIGVATPARAGTSEA